MSDVYNEQLKESLKLLVSLWEASSVRRVTFVTKRDCQTLSLISDITMSVGNILNFYHNDDMFFDAFLTDRARKIIEIIKGFDYTKNIDNLVIEMQIKGLQ